MSIQEKCRILDHQQVAPSRFKLTLASKYISSHAQPGQFVNVRCSEDYDPLLRRPLGVHNVNPKEEIFELIYEVVGKGTELLSRHQVGQKLDILGPLGNGFSIDKNKKTAILVAGGMGVAPLLYLARKLQSTKDKVQITILIGAKTKDLVLREKEFKSLTDQVVIATDDGSYGKKGFASDLLLETLDPRSLDTSATIYACGPKPMLRAIAEIAFQKKIDCQLSMEARMACGIGTCLGCVINTTKGYQKVCDDGPVFDSREIVWT